MNLLSLEFSLPLGVYLVSLKKARKALWAKGIMRQSYKMQTLTTLKFLQSIVIIQSQGSTRIFGMVEGTKNYDGSEQSQNWKDKITRIDKQSKVGNCQRKRQMHCLSRKEAILKRERIKE